MHQCWKPFQRSTSCQYDATRFWGNRASGGSVVPFPLFHHQLDCRDWLQHKAANTSEPPTLAPELCLRCCHACAWYLGWSRPWASDGLPGFRWDLPHHCGPVWRLGVLPDPGHHPCCSWLGTAGQPGCPTQLLAHLALREAAPAAPHIV